MAVTKIWKVMNRTDKVIEYAKNEAKTSKENISKFADLYSVLDYATNGEKTEEKYFVSGINCNADSAYDEMQNAKDYWNKKSGIQAFHCYQSFAEGEVTPEVAHEIGIRLAKEMWGDKFQVVVTTHINTNHIHNHFVVNSVSFKDGKKYYSNRTNTALFRELSDSLCKEYNLSIVEKPKVKKIDFKQYAYKYYSKDNYSQTAKKDLDFAIKQSYSYKDFFKLMNKLGYDIYERYGKISIRNYKYNRNIRIERRYGEFYSIENIKRRILEEESVRVPFIESYNKPFKSGTLLVSKKKYKVTGFMAIYFHYMYLLKPYPKRYPSKRLTLSMRADISKMNMFSNEAKLLATNNIETSEDLNNYEESKLDEIKELESQKEILWKKNKRTENKDIKFENNKQISKILEELENLRKEVVLIADIKTRIPEMKENIKELKNEEEQKKNQKLEKVKNQREGRNSV